LGNALQVSFAGQPLSVIAIASNPDYTVWEANVSAYSGQTGELLFQVPWESQAILDNIQFSTQPVPEPDTISLMGGLLLLLLSLRTKVLKSR
jgi:hypothetical protein